MTIGTGFTSANPLQLTFGASNATTSGAQSKHGWAPARKNRESRSVTWTWEFNYWKDTQPFSFDRPSRVKWSPHLPDLPFKAEQMSLSKTVVDAEWMVPKEMLQGVDEIEWDITIQAYTASVELKHFKRLDRIFFGPQHKTYAPKPLTSKITLRL